MTGIYILFGGLALFTLGVLIFDLVTRPPGRRDAHKSYTRASRTIPDDLPIV